MQGVLGGGAVLWTSACHLWAISVPRDDSHWARLSGPRWNLTSGGDRGEIKQAH